MASALRLLGVSLLLGLAISKRVTVNNVNMSSMSLGNDVQISYKDISSMAERQTLWPWSSDTGTTTSPVEALINKTTSAGKPLVYYTSCPKESYRGLVVYFHGFSANPAQIDIVAPKLQEACMDVFAPVLPGHGERMIENCEDGGKCSVKIDGSDKGFDLHELPVHGQSYGNFAVLMGSLAEAELEYRVKSLDVQAGQAKLMLLGLSLGSSLAYAASRAKPLRYARMLLLNPFFGSGMEEIDLKILDCMHAGKSEEECASEIHDAWMESYGGGATGGAVAYALNHTFFGGKTPGEVQAAVMTDLQRFSDWMPSFLEQSVSLMNTPVLWPANCWEIEQWGNRGEFGGFCEFQQKHVLAAHAFAIDLLQEKVRFSAPPITQIMTTARDGITRNGLTYSLAARLRAQAPNGEGVAMCMFPFSEGTDPHDNGQYWSDDHSMPHANMGKKDGWWEPELSNSIVSFFLGAKDTTGKTVEPSSLARQAAAGGDKTICMDLPLIRDSQHQLRDIVLPEADPAWASFARDWPDPPAKHIDREWLLQEITDIKGRLTALETGWPPLPKPVPAPKPAETPDAKADEHEKKDSPSEDPKHQDSSSDAGETPAQEKKDTPAEEPEHKDPPSSVPAQGGVPSCKQLEHFQRGYQVCHLGQMNPGTYACAGPNDHDVWQCNTGYDPQRVHCPHGFTKCAWSDRGLRLYAGLVPLLLFSLWSF